MTTSVATGTVPHVVVDSGGGGGGGGVVTQPIGDNLHTVVDSGTLVATQGTGTNLHTVVDSGTMVVTQTTGTNLHVVVDSGTISGGGGGVVTQSTGTNLHTVVDSGAITANAGTNLNTSTLALESGGNLASAATSLAEIVADTAPVAVLNGASRYNTVAALQTAQALTGGSGGAAGDHLATVVVFPATTSPGVVTILDNATPVASFPGGASSVSNLVPFYITLGALSVSGAWKITTGLNVSCVAVGRFT